MKYLITIDDFKAYRPICDNVDTVKKLDPYIKDAQKFELRPALGDALYYDFLKKLTDTKYQTLLNGGEYTNTAGDTVEFEGVKAVLCYWAYARYIQNSGETDTASGLRVKTNQYSEPASEKAIARRVSNARSSALDYWQDVKTFLIANSEDYSLWKGSLGIKQGGGVNITAIGDDPNDDYPDSRSTYNRSVNDC